MAINLRNALMAGKRLPYDAEVEFLESTGTQWIEIGMTFDGNTKLEMDFKFTSFPNYANCHGQTWATGNYQPRLAFGKGATSWNDWYCGVGNINFRTGKTLDTMRHSFVVDAPQKTFAIDETSYTVNWSSFVLPTNPYSASLFCRTNADNGTQDTYKISGQLYSCKIWQSSVLVRDYIPVRKGNVGYLYDRVSGKLFGNAGTGDFVLGQDVVPVEYIESHGTEYIDTGVVPTSLTKWDIDAQFTSSDYGQIMGRGGDPALNPRFAFGLDIRSSGHGLTWYCGMGDVNTWNGIFDTFRHAFSLDAPHKTFTIDTTSYNVPLSSIGDTTIMQLFARFVNGGVHNFCKAKIFKSSIIDNGLLVHSFRPVRVGTGSTWAGAMMDVLTRRIYHNAGTGAFTYGNDLKYPIPAA